MGQWIMVENSYSIMFFLCTTFKTIHHCLHIHFLLSWFSISWLISQLAEKNEKKVVKAMRRKETMR